MTGVTDLFENMYNVKWTVPLEVDIEIGKDWLNMKEKNILC
jgi:DNA polymerase I-like protein with 3'-5' exonuclease and polymerase domains